MPRSKRREQTSFSRQSNPQSYGTRGGGFEQTGTGYRYDDQQRRFRGPQSRERFGGGWSGQEDWREPSERSEYSEGRDYGSEYERESRFGRGGYEGPRGMGQQDWSRGRSGSYGGYTRVGWGPAEEEERGYWGQGEEPRYGRGREGAGYGSEDYEGGMETGYAGYEPGDYSYGSGISGFGSGERFGGSQQVGRGTSRGSGQSGYGRSQGWERSGSQGWTGPSGSRSLFGQSGSQQYGQERFQQSRGGTSQGNFVGRGPQGYKRSDERITEDVNELLTQDPDIDASNIAVEVQNGELTLKGSVSDREAKRRAEDIAESCSGVKQVQNQLRIKREDESESESKRDKGEKGDDKRSHRQQMAS
jgi:osmotically-inducible protein OsmY